MLIYPCPSIGDGVWTHCSLSFSLTQWHESDLCSFFSVVMVSRQAHACWCLNTLPHDARHVKNTSKLQFWLRARVCLDNDCQGCLTEDCPLASRLAVAHVAAFVYLSEHNPGAACLHPSCLPLSTQKGTGYPRNKPLRHAFKLTRLALSRSKLVYSSRWYVHNEVRRNTTIGWILAGELSHLFLNIFKPAI